MGTRGRWPAPWSPSSPHLFSWCLHPTVKDLGRRLDLSRTLVLLRPHPWIRNEERQFYIPVSQMESLKTNQCFKNRTKPNRARLGHTAVFHRFCFHYPTVVREGLAWTIFMTLILEKKNSPPLEKKNLILWKLCLRHNFSEVNTNETDTPLTHSTRSNSILYPVPIPAHSPFSALRRHGL